MAEQDNDRERQGAPRTGRRGRVRVPSPDIGEIDRDSDLSVERQVYALLRRAMMSGRFAPGAPLTGRSIAEGLGISSSPVRDALKRLEAHGIVSGRNKSAYFVSKLSRRQYLDIIALRMLIEGEAAASAAECATPAAIDRIRRIHGLYSETDDVAEHVRLNYLFHFEVYSIAATSIVIEVVENLWVRIGGVMHLHMQEYDALDVAESHARLIAALENRDPEEAAEALRRDLREASQIIAALLDAGEAPAAADGGRIGPGATGVAPG
jgi:GntR family transcriptional regulator, colanic acid and biofilm gene transcriptional regulator